MQKNVNILLFLIGIIASPALFAADAAETELFNGRDFSGWELISTPGAAIDSAFQILPGGVIASTGQPGGFIATKASYSNYRLHVEWRWSGKPGNSGVLIHIAADPKEGPWPLSQQIQTKNKNVGDLLPMAGASFFEPLTNAAGSKPAIKARIAADNENPVGEWNSCDILSLGSTGTVEVRINGVLQNRVTQVLPHSGRIGFQLEGTPYELRHVSLVPLGETEQ